MNKIFISSSIASFGFIVGATTILYLKRYSSKKVTKKNSTKVINEVFFFPDKEFPCAYMTKQLSVFPADERTTCHNPACRKLHGREKENPSSLLKFLTFLSDAKKSVDICIYVFTQPAMANILTNLVKAGVNVRVITDGAEDDATSNQMDKLRKSGIVIKSNKRHTGALMHHKFVIVDGQLLLAGSFNWTNKAVVSNYEAVLATSERSLVGPFVVKFEELWNEFDIHPKSKEIVF